MILRQLIYQSTNTDINNLSIDVMYVQIHSQSISLLLCAVMCIYEMWLLEICAPVYTSLDQ